MVARHGLPKCTPYHLSKAGTTIRQRADPTDENWPRLVVLTITAATDGGLNFIKPALVLRAPLHSHAGITTPLLRPATSMLPLYAPCTSNDGGVYKVTNIDTQQSVELRIRRLDQPQQWPLSPVLWCWCHCSGRAGAPYGGTHISMARLGAAVVVNG